VRDKRNCQGQRLLEGGRSDLQEAKDSLVQGNYKWATVQAYYSSFHSARALLYAKNFREQSHRGLLAAIRELYHREIPESLLQAFGDAMSMREAADYGLVYSEDGARTAAEITERFLERQTVFSGFGERRPPGKQAATQPNNNSSFSFLKNIFSRPPGGP